MNRFFRVSALVAVTMALAVPAVANIPDPALSLTPTFVTIAPDGGTGGIAVVIQVNGPLGGVDGAIVSIEFSPEATAMIAWSDPVPVGADIPVQTCPTRRYVKAASNSGLVTFHIAGGGCVVNPAFEDWGEYIVEISADDVLLAQREVNSPDVVTSNGELPTDADLLGNHIGPICEGGLMSVGLADAVYHSPFFKVGTYDKCSDLVVPYGGTIELGDATAGSVYIKNGISATCFAGCP